MKKKLNIAFALIVLSLVAIIVFQFYWTVNAYRVNKSRFNADIDLAMQRAMDNCKKDYFDSLRKVLVKRLSPPLTTIQLDTMHDADTAHAVMSIRLYNGVVPRDTTVISKKEVLKDIFTHQKINRPFSFSVDDGSISTTKPDFNSYRKKIGHRASIPEIVTEMAFYQPRVIQKIQLFLTFGGPTMVTVNTPPVNIIPTPTDKGQIKMNQASAKPGLRQGYINAYDFLKTSIVYAYPPNYRQADSIKLTRYLTKELKNMGASSPFTLKIATTADAAHDTLPKANYSQTREYNYRYHGWRIFDIVTTKEFFIRAEFPHTQYTIIKRMLATLVLSFLLVVLIFACFMYVVTLILQQKKLADLKDDFINNMTHELKTPIATITVAIEGLQKFNALNDAEKTQRYLQTSRNELNRLNDLVTKVLNIATFENKDIEMVKAPVNIDEVINEIIAIEKEKAAKTINISYLNKDDIKLIYADKLHFRNIISNLVDNAVKYSGHVVNIAITCYKDGGMLCINVKDDGIGIAPANINQVFDKFYRVPTGNVHNVKGTGLGLSYVKYIAQAHGGNVRVKSEISMGAEFTVCLPL